MHKKPSVVAQAFGKTEKVKVVNKVQKMVEVEEVSYIEKIIGKEVIVVMDADCAVYLMSLVSSVAARDARPFNNAIYFALKKSGLTNNLNKNPIECMETIHQTGVSLNLYNKEKHDRLVKEFIEKK